ncbi:MAG: molecular chaperone HtpG [Chlamydiales bacterium]|nr:molecular chaperone HtpG [Chlamydiales bacterium]
MATKSKKKLKIHSQNILPIIKKWLYSERDIFIRELVSNACDAISKLKVLVDEKQAEIEDDNFRIDINIDKEKKTLTFSDTGIGMSKDEVEKYIAQIAFSGAEEFVEKYQSNSEKEQIIGHFGLGFYSTYMVSELVEIQTQSHQKDQAPCLWSCDGSPEYTIEEGSKESRGTEIILHINKESEEYLEEATLMEVLNKYCSFLPFPIFLNGTQINTKDPLWLKNPSECEDKDYIEFYKKLYPFEEEPLFWVHLNVDYPFHLRGILYFPKFKRDFDFSKCNLSLFCNRVFVSDNCKDLIPEYLTVLRGAIDSPDIPLNVSRSYLQMDTTVRQLSKHISKKVSDKLSSLYNSDKEKFIEAWQDVNLVVKLGALQDEKFYDRVKKLLIWQNTDNEWTTIEEYQERHPNSKDTVFYTNNAELHTKFIELYKNKGIEVLVLSNPIDMHLLSFLESKLSPLKVKRIDGDLDEGILDSSKEKNVLDADGKTEAARLADFFREAIGDEQVDVEAKSLASEHLPGFIVLDEQSRRMRDFLVSQDPKKHAEADSLIAKKKLVVNTSSKLANVAKELSEKDKDVANQLALHLYDLLLLSQQEMQPSKLDSFLSRSQEVLEKLAEKAQKA